MEIVELEAIFERILENTQKAIKRQARGQIYNEQYFHGQFSDLVSRHYSKKHLNAWPKMLLVPGHPTETKYLWERFKMDQPRQVMARAINKGNSARFDFLINDKPRILVEWKGPDLYEARDVAQSLIKLLIEKPDAIKVFAAIITSSKKADDAHLRELTMRFYEALRFVQQVLGIRDIRKINLYAYIATMPDNGVQKFIWGKV
jgi:hypothetical protein